LGSGPLSAVAEAGARARPPPDGLGQGGAAARRAGKPARPRGPSSPGARAQSLPARFAGPGAPRGRDASPATRPRRRERRSRPIPPTIPPSARAQVSLNSGLDTIAGRPFPEALACEAEGSRRGPTSKQQIGRDLGASLSSSDNRRWQSPWLAAVSRLLGSGGQNAGQIEGDGEEPCRDGCEEGRLSS
jgi:hypothetical protein